MADPINDGGPAFPVPECEDRESGPYLPAHHGMTLRDWFAGQALAGWFASFAGADQDHINEFMGDFDHSAKTAYEVADAMLKARSAK